MPRQLALLAALLLVPALLPLAEGAKVEFGQPLGTPLVSPAAVMTPGAIYTFGGRVPDDVCIDRDGARVLVPRFTAAITRIDTRTGESRLVASLPGILDGSGGRQAATAIWTGSKAYVFGGAILLDAGDNDGDGCTDLYVDALASIVEFDPATHAARVIEDRLPVALWGAAAVWTGKEALIYGGVGITPPPDQIVTRYDHVLRFDPGAQAGSRLTTMRERLPFALQDPAVAHANGTTWLFGGLGSHTAGAFECFSVQDPDTGASEPFPYCPSERVLRHDLVSEKIVETQTRMPRALQFAAAAPMPDGNVYVLGGRRPNGQATGDILKFDPTTGGIETLPPALPGGRYAPAHAADRDRIYLAGGKLNGTVYLRSVIAFTPGASEPWAPASVRATNVSTLGASLEWDPPAYDGGAPLEGFRIYRARPGSGHVAPLGETGIANRAWQDATADPGADYVYLVHAFNAKGESVNGAAVQVTTRPRAPDAPEAFRAYAGNDLAVLRWHTPRTTGGLPLLAYAVYRDGVHVANATPSALEYEDRTAENGRAYAYAVSAVNALGESARVGPIIVRPAPVPHAPTDLTATPYDGGIRLAWTASASAVEGYHVYRGDFASTGVCYDAERGFEPGSPRACALVTGAPFDDATAERGRRYWYNVTAVGPHGASAPTPHVAGARLLPPSPPLAVSAVAGPLRVEVTWKPPLDWGGADAVAYGIVRANPDGSRVRFNASAPNFTDTNVTEGETYAYAVFALNPLAGGTSPEARATPGGANAIPAARLSASPVDAAAGERVRFDASLSRDEDGRIVEYGFRFGDGSPVLWTKNPQTTHAYRRDGAYRATLLVKDDLGALSEPDEILILVGSGDSGGDAPLRLRGKGAPGETPGKGIPFLGAPFHVGVLGALAFTLGRARRRPQS